MHATRHLFTKWATAAWGVLAVLVFAVLLTNQVAAQTGTATVNTGALNVRSGPGIDYAAVAIVYQNDVVTMLGRNAASSWVKIRLPGSGNTEGWVNVIYLTPSVAISTLPVLSSANPTSTPATPPPTATPAPAGSTAFVNTGALNLRSGPGVSYNPVSVALQGEILTLLGRNENSSWVKVRRSNAAEGWVNVTLITPNVTISSLNVASYSAITAAATVSTGAANVRSGPGVNYSVLTVASYGTAVDLLGRSSNSGWVNVRLTNGTEGWINATLLTTNVTVSSLPVAASPAAPEAVAPVNTGNTLSIYAGPGTSYAVTGTVYQGLGVTATGRNASSSWIKITLSDGQQGWIPATYVQLNIALSDLPVLDATAAPETAPSANSATVNTGAANVRSGPGIGYGIVAVAGQGNIVTLIGRNTNSSWAKVRLANNTEGWINSSLLDSTKAINSLPIIEATTLSAAALVNTPALNVRTGPAITYDVVAIVYQDQAVALIGRNSNTSWVKVRLTDGRAGWVNAAYLTSATTLNSLPVTE